MQTYYFYTTEELVDLTHVIVKDLEAVTLYDSEETFHAALQDVQQGTVTYSYSIQLDNFQVSNSKVDAMQFANGADTSLTVTSMQQASHDAQADSSSPADASEIITIYRLSSSKDHSIEFANKKLINCPLFKTEGTALHYLQQNPNPQVNAIHSIVLPTSVLIEQADDTYKIKDIYKGSAIGHKVQDVATLPPPVFNDADFVGSDSDEDNRNDSYSSDSSESSDNHAVYALAKFATKDTTTTTLVGVIKKYLEDAKKIETAYVTKTNSSGVSKNEWVFSHKNLIPAASVLDESIAVENIAEESVSAKDLLDIATQDSGVKRAANVLQWLNSLQTEVNQTERYLGEDDDHNQAVKKQECIATFIKYALVVYDYRYFGTAALRKAVADAVLPHDFDTSKPKQVFDEIYRKDPVSSDSSVDAAPKIRMLPSVMPGASIEQESSTKRKSLLLPAQKAAMQAHNPYATTFFAYIDKRDKELADDFYALAKKLSKMLTDPSFDPTIITKEIEALTAKAQVALSWAPTPNPEKYTGDKDDNADRNGHLPRLSQ